MKYSEIAYFLNKNLIGADGEFVTYASLDDIKPGSVVFAKRFDTVIVDILNSAKNIVAIVTSEYEGRLHVSHILSSNPRLDYLRVLEHFFSKEEIKVGIHPTAVVESGAEIGKEVCIGANCYIGKQVKIGDGSFISPNVVIEGVCEIGRHVHIKSGAVIGQSGFGFEKDERGVPVHFCHLGKIVIGDYVYIGANTAIDRATLGATIIGNHVKIDNLVHIAHNVVIDDNSMVIAGTVLGGGVHIGRNCWIAPNVSIKQQLRIGDNALVGLGAVVVKNVKADSTVIGNPAKELMK
ncbi:UDP-3-O-(3-hydroxymyristoyl)glucosamine N-acyltransferase [Gabonibacter chumensis]|uniref:UDP-3-O-(3-hydroxymyristoyl)glucosamine N-acyltransferase n=1 Tax=Gabonibacter chumensis TaxID=2972474 RepID=UPI0025746344|nr:UDP-3-O-(3-hydroxymyristoyl)glucosamine N-acyltransferase [Gabonibacter chumensis]MCR9013058.1 UDP-3-O-(3-hydroxymyristoyl)glucosamine N-acyltransferase [Gabonibacter chumensis]